jgi:AraC-like DNA-binding protein
MYSGHSTQAINGKKIQLNEKEIIILEKDVVHEVGYLGENDILINILVDEKMLNTEMFFENIHAKTFFHDFLLHAIKENTVHEKHLVIDVSSNGSIQNLLANMIAENYGEKPYKQEVLKLYFSLLSFELGREIELTITGNETQVSPKMMAVIQQVDQHYADITLETVAKKLGYNVNYMSSKIKKELGISFKTLVKRKRLNVAKELLQNDEVPIEEVISILGYRENSYFFKEFKKEFGYTPLQYRKKNDVKSK